MVMPVDEKLRGMDERLYRMRHSCAHVMAEAVLEMFPGAKLAIGPPIENGFYYDFDLPRPLTPEDLVEIERRMRASIEADKPFVRSTEPRDEALRELADQPYKKEIIEGLGDQEISFYQHGDFKDLCEGPHVESTGKIGAFKLLNVAGAYWRGDEKRPMLQRIYGACFATQEELDRYLHNLEEARRRDHRVLGRELDLFSFHEEYGPGLVYWHPKGGRVRTIIEDFWRQEHYRAGYDIVYTPHIGRSTLWETSGHLDFYNENMYSPMDVDEQDYYIKPMNCPFHIQIYKSGIRSYRELPLRFAELGTVYRYERSGVLHGLARVRGFTQDDAHIFCRPDQVEAEVSRTLDFVLFVLRTFGFKEFQVAVATKPEKAVGREDDWRMATDALRRAVSAAGLQYDIDEGGGAFYGPKIDLHIKDALGRAWQCSTIQFDFNLPERFDISFIGEDGTRQRPYMVHRALLGSIERFFGVLIEHYGGAFPLWLAPVQAKLIPIADRHIDYCERVADDLRAEGLRVEVDARNERMQAKIRDAQLQKVPYMLIAGDRDVTAGAVSVRTRAGDDLGAMPVFQVIDRLKDEVVTGMNPEEAISG
ncbi:MAG TPA: threonine--tRNA ligase [Dehalococcoidia bacterium]|nr:threonine--tRNA ligase [Dehalococcoidia bacterium]